MLDHLSGGRLEIGLASGVGPREFRAVGMQEEEMRPRFAEALDIIDMALTQPRVTQYLDRAGLSSEIGAENFFWSSDRAILDSVAKYRTELNILPSNLRKVY